MYDEKELTEIERKKTQWESETLNKILEKHGERKPEFVTTSSMPVKRLFLPTDMKNFNYIEKLGFPSEYPFTRACIQQCIVVGFGLCVCSLALGALKNLINGINICLNMVKQV